MGGWQKLQGPWGNNEQKPDKPQEAVGQGLNTNEKNVPETWRKGDISYLVMKS